MYFPATPDGIRAWHKDLFLQFGWMQLVIQYSNSKEELESSAYNLKLESYWTSMKLFCAKLAQTIEMFPESRQELKILLNQVKILRESFKVILSHYK